MMHRIALREQHIEAGRRASSSLCAVDLAIKEAIGSRLKTVEVVRSEEILDIVDIRIDGKLYNSWPRYAVETFVLCFDGGRPVSPFTFRIEPKTVVHLEGWKKLVTGRGQIYILGNFGVTRCGMEIGRTALSSGRFVSFCAEDTPFIEKMKLRWRLFRIGQVFAGSNKPDWAIYCRECLNTNAIAGGGLYRIR
ncbi:MAG: hypothetical protein OXQ89_01845 [Rhodospirillaceae bacterium]|nr:hypothetical protein [Rhodospirillaceae bacterium]MDD9996466.1 hypothetical protein [Rhodospirillaceae bacterium]